MKKPLEIFDYREFLVNHAEAKQLANPHWNYSMWAKALGLQSTSSLTKVLSGDRKPGPNMVDRLVHYFKFNAEEENQFRSLVLLSKDKTATVMSSLLKRTQKTENALQFRVLELFEFRLVSEWQHLAIRELFRVKNLKLTTQKIKKLLHDDLALETIEKSIALLKSLNLLKKNPQGDYFSSDEQVITQNDTPDAAIQSYHEQKLDQAKKRLRDTSVEERCFQSLTLLIDHDDLPKIKLKIRNFIQELEAEVDAKKVNQLYQFQLQLFPMSNAFEKKQEFYTQNEVEKSQEKR
jgi:uncharacterized protein (TIGR02147 family)